jgi:hypothetical protein
MAITSIGGIIISSDFIIEDPFGSIGVDSSVERAADRTVHVWEQDGGSYDINLIGGDNIATMTQAELIQIKALANIPWAYYPLIFKDVDYGNVRFRNEDPPAIEAVPIAQGATIYKNIRIKLMSA